MSMLSTKQSRAKMWRNNRRQTKKKINVQSDCDTKKVLLDEMVWDQAVVIGSDLSPGEEGALIQFVQNNRDVFAWSAKDLTGVDQNFIEHKLNIDASVKPRRQKLRKMSDDKVVAVKSEVQRLLDASVIREVMYPKWIANTAPVKKKNVKWRMCIDFTDLNKATPKIIICFQEWTRSLIQRPTRPSCLSWIAFLATINARWRKRTRKKLASSLLLALSVSCECPRI
jgi:hypothetical protein